MATKDKAKKKIKIMNQSVKSTLFWIGGIISLLILVAGFRVLLNMNYFMSVILSIVITFGVFTTVYLTKIKVPEHQYPKKETINYNDFELAEAKRCSICGDKLIKSKVIEDGYGISQSIKCRNIHCSYHKIIRFGKDGQI